MQIIFKVYINEIRMLEHTVYKENFYTYTAGSCIKELELQAKTQMQTFKTRTTTKKSYDFKLLLMT